MTMASILLVRYTPLSLQPARTVCFVCRETEGPEHCPAMRDMWLWSGRQLSKGKTRAVANGAASPTSSKVG